MKTIASCRAATATEARRPFAQLAIVLERMLGMALNAGLERMMHADGIEWRITVPRPAEGDDAP